MKSVFIVIDLTETELGEIERIFETRQSAEDMINHLYDNDYGSEYKIVEWPVHSSFDGVKFEHGE